jgi:hypothetical protein
VLRILRLFQEAVCIELLTLGPDAKVRAPPCFDVQRLRPLVISFGRNVHVQRFNLIEATIIKKLQPRSWNAAAI